MRCMTLTNPWAGLVASEIKLIENCSTIFDLARRNNLKFLDLFFCFLASVGFNDADDNVDPLLSELMGILEHLIRLAYTGGCSYVNAQFGTLVLFKPLQETLRRRAKTFSIGNLGTHCVYKHIKPFLPSVSLPPANAGGSDFLDPIPDSASKRLRVLRLGNQDLVLR